jgi:hypothetical protein
MRNIFRHTESAIRLPRPPAPAPSPAAFVFIAFGSLPGQSPQLWAWQQCLYQQALEQAQALARPSLPERDLLGYWN